MKNLKFTMLILLALMLTLAACGGGAAEQAVQEAEEAVEEVQESAEEAVEEAEEVVEEAVEEAEEAVSDGEKIELEFWHAMGGNLGETVDELVARFNESQDKIVVNATFQGSYDDTYNALLAAFDAGTEPNITQNFDLASQTMIDTGRLIPAYVLMQEDNYDANTFLPAVRDYYSNENGMVAMAFNSSTPLIYYNADMFEAAGVDPPNPEWTFSDFKATCDQLLEADVAPFCFTYGQVGWYFEQILANSGGLYFNNNNGRTGRPTEAVFNEGQGVEVFTFLTSLIQEGYAPNLGSTWTETDSTFTTGQAAMQIDSTSDVSIIENSEFEVGTAYIPHSDSSERNGVIIGGAALWLIDSGDEAENAAAWEFMKFMAAPAQQITWHTNSGYFPVRVDLQENPELNQFWDENPNFRTAIEQLATTNTTLDDGSLNYAVLGGRAGPFPAIRQIIVEAYSRVLDDGLSPQEALDEAAEKANEELENYNAFFGEEGAGAAPQQEEPAAEEAMGEVVELEFWHAMGGNLGETVDELVARFNESQDEIVVSATFQGSYDDTYNALLAAFDAGTEPNITQNFDLASQTMIDTGRLIPAWRLMEADGYDPSIFVPAVRDYYSDENGMVAMAFNSSTPLIYYNADMFEAAGVDPPNPEWTFSDFKATCDQLLEADVAPFCFTYGQVGWYFEQILANSGGLYFNNDNGRTARPTEAVFNEGQGVEVFTFLTSLIQEGYAPNLGSTWTETDSTFITGQAAMQIDSTSDVSIIENSEFEVGTAYIPHSDSSERNGVIIGGAALWLIDSGDEAENAAAWEFMKFMAELEQQKTWHTNSGYFPVRVDAADDSELQEFWDENPNFTTAIEQLATTDTTLPDGSPNYAVLGGRAGPFPAIRQIIVEAYSRVLDDGLSPQEALNEAAEKANEELENYNAFFE